MAALVNFSESCERNKAPILQVLAGAFKNTRSVLEVGSGSGQHALYLAEHLQHLDWQPSDQGEYLPGLVKNLTLLPLVNLRKPVALDVSQAEWPELEVDGVFSANSLHIMSWEHVVYFFRGVGEMLTQGGTLCVYGPFNYSGSYSSESNARFDIWLKERDLVSGIRDFEKVNALAEKAGFEFVMDYSMPANNQLLVWRK